MDLSEVIQDHAVIEGEARGILDDGDLRNSVQHPVIEFAHPGYQRIGPTHGFDCEHDLVALFPSGDELLDQFWRVLEVRCQDHGGIAAGLEDAPARRADVAEISRGNDNADARIHPRESPELVHRAVRRGIVDEEILEVILGQAGHHAASTAVKFVDITLLVEAGRYQADELPMGHGSYPSVGPFRERRKVKRAWPK